MEKQFVFFLNECSLILNGISLFLGNQFFLQRKWILGTLSEVIFRKAPLCRVGGIRSRWGTWTSLSLQSTWHPGRFSKYVDWQKPEFLASATPPTHAFYKMFHSTNTCFRLYESSKSEWSLLLWETKTGERTVEECFPMTGYLPGPGLLIWACAKGDRHRRLLTVGETEALWGAFATSPFFLLAPPPHLTVEQEWLAPYHHWLAVRVVLALPARLASRRNRAQLQGPHFFGQR